MSHILNRMFRNFCVLVSVGFWFPAVGACEGSERPAFREPTVYVGAQASSLLSEPAIDALVKNLAEPLKAVKARNVVVLDLRGPNGGLYPAGKWISDHLSVAMSAEFPKLKIIDRSQLVSSDETPGPPTEEGALFKKEIQEARKVGADVVIVGNFAAVSGQIGISLSVVKISQLEKTHETKSGVIPIPKEFWRADLAGDTTITIGRRFSACG
jgi:hypothetical protein